MQRGTDQAQHELERDGEDHPIERANDRAVEFLGFKQFGVVLEPDIAFTVDLRVGERQPDSLQQGPSDNHGDKQNCRQDQRPGKTRLRQAKPSFLPCCIYSRRQPITPWFRRFRPEHYKTKTIPKHIFCKNYRTYNSIKSSHFR